MQDSNHLFMVMVICSAGVSIGSEMSGGIEQVLVEGVHVWGSRRGIRIKTSPGRGGYVKDIWYQNLTLRDIRVGIVIKTDYGEHPDSEFDPQALPIVANISFDDIHGSSVRYPVRMFGSQEVPITGIEIRNMNVGLTSKKRNVFTCAFIQGKVIGKVFPTPCKALLGEEDHRF